MFYILFKYYKYSWSVQEMPRFWRGCYPAYTMRPANKPLVIPVDSVVEIPGSSNDGGPVSTQQKVIEAYYTAVDALATNDLNAAVIALDLCGHHESLFTLNTQLRKFYGNGGGGDFGGGMRWVRSTVVIRNFLNNCLGHDTQVSYSFLLCFVYVGVVLGCLSFMSCLYLDCSTGSWANTAWELFARAKKFEDSFAFDSFAYIDYTLAIRLCGGGGSVALEAGEFCWRRGLLVRRRGTFFNTKVMTASVSIKPESVPTCLYSQELYL